MKQTITAQITANIDYWTGEIDKEEKGESNYLKETAKTMEEIKQEMSS